MNNIQINGQRRWGPPESWIGPPPAHGTEIFVKNLPGQVLELELYAMFSCVGNVYEVRLPVNWNGLNRGYAFVRFTTVQEADEAIETLDGYEIRRNRKIKVTRSVDNTRLFLSAVPIEKNAHDLKQDLLNYVENVKKVYVYPTLENRSLFRGYAFIEFETHRDAAIAKRILTSDVCYNIFKKNCIAAWANPLPFLDRSLQKSLNVLFMRNIPKDMKGFHLKRAIENLTGGEEIQKIKKINNFAFLTFKNHESAERALIQLQNISFLISDHETQVEWAIPREIVSSSLSNREKQECEESEVNRTGYQASNKKFISDTFTSGLKMRYTTHLEPSLQVGMNLQESSIPSSATVSTGRDRNYVDNTRIIHSESGMMLPKRQREEGYTMRQLSSRRVFLPPLAIPSSSNNVIHTTQQNLDTTNSDNISEKNPLRSITAQEAICSGYSDKPFNEATNSDFSITKNLGRCNFFPSRFNFEDTYSSDETARTNKSISSPLSLSSMTAQSSESSQQSPFFENTLFSLIKNEERFFNEENHNISNSRKIILDTNYLK